MYPVYSTSLRSIRWVGRKTENLLVNVGIDSAESLFMVVQRNIHRNYIQHGMDEDTSIRTTLKSILSTLPVENITNITDVLIQMRSKATFMLKVA